MKKLVIILAIAIMLFATLKQRTEQSSTATEGSLLSAAMEKAEDSNVAESEETVQCVDKGNQSLAEYKSQPSGQPNPFETAKPAEIVDQPVGDLIGEGEDRPGEGKHF